MRLLKKYVLNKHVHLLTVSFTNHTTTKLHRELLAFGLTNETDEWHLENTTDPNFCHEQVDKQLSIGDVSVNLCKH